MQFFKTSLSAKSLSSNYTKWLFLPAFFLLVTFCAKAGNYTISNSTPLPGTTITVTYHYTIAQMAGTYYFKASSSSIGSVCLTTSGSYPNFSTTYTIPANTPANTTFTFAMNLGSSFCSASSIVVRENAAAATTPNCTIPTAAAVTGSGGPYCVGSAATALTATFSGSTATSYIWYADGALISGATLVNYTPPTTTIGTKTYTVQVTNICGTSTISAVGKAVTVNTTPFAATISGAAGPYCQNATATALTASFSGGTATNYQWYADGVAINGANSINYTPGTTAAVTKNYTVTVTNNCGTSGQSASKTIVVNSAPAITSQLPLSAAATCAGTNTDIAITASGTNLNYQWYFNGVALAADHTDVNGTYTGSTGNTLHIAPLGVYYNGGKFYCVAKNTCSSATSATVTLTVNNCYVTVNAKAILQGAWGGTAMSTMLNSLHLIPGTQPYSSALFSYTGTETTTTTFLNANPTIVDWVLVEVRDATTPATIIARRAAFINSNGILLDTNGTAGVKFYNTPAGNYFISIRHRNHLGIRSTATQALSNNSALYNFTTDITTANGTAPMVSVGSVFCMWAGNAEHTVNSTGSQVINYGASTSDIDFVRIAVTNATGNNLHNTTFVGSAVTKVYSVCDINLDGNIRYSVSPSDVDIIRTNVTNLPANTMHNAAFAGLVERLP